MSAGAVIYTRDIERLSAFYTAVLGLQVSERAADHCTLERTDFQLVLVRAHVGAEGLTGVDKGLPIPRSDAAIKLAFVITDIDAARRAADTLGGHVNDADREWFFGDARVCDGCDPDGNVIQLRETASSAADRRITNVAPNG